VHGKSDDTELKIAQSPVEHPLITAKKLDWSCFEGEEVTPVNCLLQMLSEPNRGKVFGLLAVIMFRPQTLTNLELQPWFNNIAENWVENAYFAW